MSDLHHIPLRRRRPASAAAILAALATVAWVSAGPAAAAVTVTVDRPLDGDLLASPIDLAARAETDAAGGQVTGWQVYVDGVSAYGNGGPNAAMSARLNLPNGDHEIVVFVWDANGDYASSQLTLTVGTCSGFTVSLDSPLGGSEPSPVHFAASAASCHRVTAFAVYADGQIVYQQRGARSVDTTVELPAGNHTVMARAWDAAGGAASSPSATIDVVPAAPPPAPPAKSPARPPARPAPANPPPPAPHR
jgi:hypothetical protein